MIDLVYREELLQLRRAGSIVSANRTSYVAIGVVSVSAGNVSLVTSPKMFFAVSIMTGDFRLVFFY
jgi:hypothetical protein